MPENQSTLRACLHKARELRITDGFGLFLLTKAPDVPDYRLVNCADSAQFKLWLQKKTHQFVCIIDSIDILLIDSSLPFNNLDLLFGRCEALAPRDRTCLELADFLDLLKEQANATPPPVPN